MAAAEFSSHVIPTLACAIAWNLWLRNIIVIRLIMKTRHCISGCGGVVLSGLVEAEKRHLKLGTASAR